MHATQIDQLLDRVTELNIKLNEILEVQASPWMTAEDCADFLKISKRQLSRLIQRGYIKSKRMKSPSNDDEKENRRENKLRIRIHREWADQYVMFGKLRLTALERKQLNDLRFPEKRERF